MRAICFIVVSIFLPSACKINTQNSKALMVGGEVCKSEEFPATVKILTSIRDEADTEVAIGICTGVVIDPKMVLTDNHCFLQNPMDVMNPLPPDLVKIYREKQQKLVTKYEIDGKTARFAVEISKSRQGILIFDQPFTVSPMPFKTDVVFEKGNVCTLVGYSPFTEFQAEAKINPDNPPPPALPEVQKTPEQMRASFIEKAKVTRSKFLQTEKRCGQTKYTGHKISKGSYIKIFEGVTKGYASATAGDSGGGCFFKSGNDWQLVGILELGDVVVFVNDKDEVERAFEEKPRNNGIILFNSQAGIAAQELLTLARKVRDGESLGPEVSVNDAGHIVGRTASQ